MSPCSLGLLLEGCLCTNVPWLGSGSFKRAVCPLDVEPWLQKGCMEMYELFQVKCFKGLVALHLKASDMLPKGPPDLEVNL